MTALYSAADLKKALPWVKATKFEQLLLELGIKAHSEVRTATRRYRVFDEDAMSKARAAGELWQAEKKAREAARQAKKAQGGDPAARPTAQLAAKLDEILAQNKRILELLEMGAVAPFDDK